MLFEPARHEPLVDAAWDEAAARAAIVRIVADTEAAMLPDASWPWHPLDLSETPEPPHKSIYLGAAGVVAALATLQRSGLATLRRDPRELAAPLHAAYLAAPDTGDVVPSWFLGEAGILSLQWRLAPSERVADRLHAIVAANATNPTREALWGAPGTMLAAWHMARWSGEARWENVWRASADALWEAWEEDEAGQRLWTQSLYGHDTRYLGAAHGFAGNAFALLQGQALLAAAQRDELVARCARTLAATVLLDGDGANWPPAPGDGKRLMQWCHGAPGIVTSFAVLPRGASPVVDDLLLRAGHAIWQAGPLSKGPGLCHGTAGNGFAFLKLHTRTGDPVWLDRARAFAMHAIGQTEAARVEFGRRRYTLWTGDPGIAVFLAGCANASDEVPTLDEVG